MKKGIKALGMNMEAIKGNCMVYELNIEYIYCGDVICKCSGYHYFESIRDVMTLYNISVARLFECELNGDKYDHYDTVHCTNKIKLIREISKEEITKYIEDNLDELVNDKDWYVRLEIARLRYSLDKLVNDEEYEVRREVAKQGYGLDKLINDKHWYVRCEVAKQGYGLDKLINDKDKYVRLEALNQLELRKNKEN